MSDILLLSMPYSTSYGKISVKNLGFWVPPVGIAYIASFLKEKGFDVALVDLAFTDNLGEVKEIVKHHSPRLLGLSATTPQINDAFITAKIAKEINPAIKTIVGGAHASALPLETIGNKNIDILAYGEGELTMAELAAGRALSGIKGIYYKEDERIIRNEPRELVENIDMFPYPLYEQLPIDKYGKDHFAAILGIVSSRGCPYHCVYCAANTIHKRLYRKRSVENVIGEIEKFKYVFGADKFSFYDDTFTLDSHRTTAICEAILKKNLGLTWNCITRADHLTKPLLKTLKRAGCTNISIGIESGDNEILRLAKRKKTVEEVTQAVEWAKELHIEVIGLFIIGLPHETEATIQKTINFAKRLKIDYAQFSILVPLPGSEVWDMVQKEELLKFETREWSDFGRYGKAIISLKDVSRDKLSYYLTKAYREFYLRPAYMWGRLLSIRSLRDIRNLIVRGMALIKFTLRK